MNTLAGARALPVLECDVTERREPLYDIPDRPGTITLNAAGLRRRDTESVSSLPAAVLVAGGCGLS